MYVYMIQEACSNFGSFLNFTRQVCRNALKGLSVAKGEELMDRSKRSFQTMFHQKTKIRGEKGKHI